ncbi:ABC transporter permease [Anaerocolumna sedimenticola]|uniref:ABC transporter permease n=1 Tax=Anaerocolumna sedimenticola TaxID=2696063 RepID=A0A6P1TTJ5_9FIRM|nr:ABC transporter permease [Anaerocolumna sedimenticola]QHQ63529.1 ABC transporter permease [Anaerocolumna sedimenticola]
MLSIWKRIIYQIRNDKRSLGLLLFAPLLVLTLLYFILGDSDYVPKIAVYDMDQTYIIELEQNAEVTIVDEKPDVRNYLEEAGADAFLWKDTSGLHITLLEKNSKSAAAIQAIQKTNQVFNKGQTVPDISYIYETNENNQLDSLSYVFLGVLSFFFVFILSGMSFVRERFGQTLERMLMTPISRFAVIGGYTLGYGVLSAIQSILIILFSVYVLKLQVEGSILLCILVMILMSFSAVSIGALASIFSNNELQMVQFIPIVLIPQIFYSGLIPLDTIPFGLGKLCYLIPVYYGCTSLEKIMIQGKGFLEILPWVAGSILYIAALFAINVLALKKYRRL